MRVLFVISEAEPYVKSGGLGDIGGSLPMALKKQGVDIRVILPKYSSIPKSLANQIRHLRSTKINLGWRKKYCGLEEMQHEGIHYYFIDNEYYFKRDKPYGYEDDAERFAFFSKGVLENLVFLEDFKPDIIHCHDWHTALIPLGVKECYSHNPFYFDLKTIFTIHNLRYQGVLPMFALGDLLGLEGNGQAKMALEYNQGINLLKGALVYADKITTVSPNYKEEIMTPYFGEGLSQMLGARKEELSGILNGIDYERYNPKTDKEIFVHYQSTSNKKQENKTRLQELLNLPVSKKTPLLALVSRLVPQKGLDLLDYIMEELLEGDLQLVILGSGEARYENRLKEFAWRYPDKLSVNLGFDDSLARKIYAATDVLLMPSLFEPCGLSQMIGMRYGAVPLVRETGGLKDSVRPFNEYTEEGNGFSFANFNAHDFLNTIWYALKIYYEKPKTWTKIIENGQKQDFSWASSAKEYHKLYRELLS